MTKDLATLIGPDQPYETSEQYLATIAEDLQQALARPDWRGSTQARGDDGVTTLRSARGGGRERHLHGNV
jgi:hypothetical protein